MIAGEKPENYREPPSNVNAQFDNLQNLVKILRPSPDEDSAQPV